MMNRKTLTIFFFTCCITCLFLSAEVHALTAKDKYLNADAAYKKLRSNEKKKKYRHNWLSCIKKYQAVYKHDPSGPWAAAGLYKSGLLYFDLHHYSGRASDKNSAIKILEQVVDQYPQSRYRKKAKKTLSKSRTKQKRSSSKTASAKKKHRPEFGCIVIDPGHGGKDYGAPGYYKGIHEKGIVLSVSKNLRKELQKRLDCEIILTRQNDKFLTLDQRTKIANDKNASLFISIHTNASKNRRAYGIETFILNHATDEEAARVAAIENNTTAEQVSDLQLILSSLMQNAKINESSQFAGYVQKAVYTHMRTDYSKIKNKGIKQAPFIVLIGAHMPSILIETGFISNSRECKRLNDSGYQKKLCKAIADGIMKYIEEANTSAFINKPEKPNPSG